MEIICYLSNGYPTLKQSVELAKEYADAGCNIMEVDFPSRNPYLEGDYIANRMKEALTVCDDYEKYMENIVKMKENLSFEKMLILVYEDTVKEIGVEKFIEFCLRHELLDILLVGLNDKALKQTMMQQGLKVSCYVQFHLPQEEVEVAKEANGFVYLQAKPSKEPNPKYPELKDCIQYLRKKGIARPIYCGVGIHTLEDAKHAKEAGADAVFVGSTILKLQDNIPEMKKVIQEFLQQ